MCPLRVYHSAKHASALTERPRYAGIYTSDMATLSGVAFIITRIFKGEKIEVIYTLILIACSLTYLSLIAKNQILPKGWFAMVFRKSLGERKKVMIFSRKSQRS